MLVGLHVERAAQQCPPAGEPLLGLFPRDPRPEVWSVAGRVLSWIESEAEELQRAFWVLQQ